MTTATEMRPRARIVLRVSGMPRRGTLRRAVKTNSNAEAKAFRIELSFFRKRLVTIPNMELFRIRMMTRGWLIEDRADVVKAFIRSP